MHVLSILVLLWSGTTQAAENSGEYALAAGLGTVSYGNTLIFGGLVMASHLNNHPDSRPAKDFLPMFVPGIGPFWAIHTLDAKAGDRRLLIVDGVIQSTAVGLLLVGIVHGPGKKPPVALGVSPIGTVRLSGHF